MLVAPPCLNKYKIGNLISSQLKIIHIDIMDLLKKEISAKNENSKNILNSLEQNDLVHNKHILKLLEDKLYSSECMINGWIITGFSKSELQINYMEKMNSEIKPSLIAVIDTDEKKIEENAKKKDMTQKLVKIILKEIKNILNQEMKISKDYLKENKMKVNYLKKELKIGNKFLIFL